ncbi:MAG: prephenate dehydratase [Janthinobacterium lividum]
MTTPQQIAIQGERGSNSHIAALQMLGSDIKILPCSLSADVVAAVLSARVDGAVLPIENSLHGSVAEHYDLLLDHPLRIESEGLLRIEHNVIAAPGVRLQDLRTLLSHPVALSQCRHFLASFTQGRALPFYDTAGSVRHVVMEGLRDVAGIAPRLAAEIYGGEVLVANIEDHHENFTRFHLLRHEQAPALPMIGPADKLSLAFAVEHRPGTLVQALAALAAAGANLTKIESRPVRGRPWEYVFFVDLRFEGEAMAEAVLRTLRAHCSLVKELGRYQAA